MRKGKKTYLFVVILISVVLSLSGFLPSSKKNLNLPKGTVSEKSVEGVVTQAISTTQTTVPVSKVVDGDTIDVLINDKKQSVRILGINTPETVDPRKSVECFGKEASDKAKSILTGKNVRLESDPTQDDRDKYGRLLRYVAMPDGSDFGLEMIREGYAYEYTYEVPYERQKEYKNAQNQAENQKLGLWNDTTCNGKL